MAEIGVKKMIYLDPSQNEIVKRLAREAKSSEAEVIRRAIVSYAGASTARMLADTRRVTEHLKKYPEWNDDPSELLRG